jgi:hypothetical protein
MSSICSLSEPWQYDSPQVFGDCSYKHGQKVGIILFLITVLIAWWLYRTWSEQGQRITSTFWMWMLGWFLLFLFVLPYIFERRAVHSWDKMHGEWLAYQRQIPNANFRDFLNYLNMEKQTKASSKMATAQTVSSAAFTGLAASDLWRTFGR